MAKGTLLHDVLALYYERLKAGIKHSTAIIDARSRLQGYLAGNAYALDTITEVDKLLNGYWNHYQGDPDWEILGVETGYDLTLAEAYTYSLRLDLLVRVRSTGATVLVDHKTAYNFWTEDSLNLNPQFPKYIASLRANGINVDYAILNQIRTRSLKAPGPDDLYRRTKCVPSIAKLTNAMKEQIIASQRIVQHRELPLEVRNSTSLRTLNKMVCDGCRVKSLCMSEYDGGDISIQIQTDYQPRTYGYNDPTEDDL
jgi:hypothetical protein